ncbi:hypothetical protein ACJJTC_014201 [Scirpophaga incertulas]
MYIYNLPFEINRELCRILDNDDDWKELAGHMSYKMFDIKEIEQVARRSSSSPTNELFRTWGQQNHRVGELFILLYRMKHIPALTCLVPVVEEKFHLLYKKICPNGIRQRDTTAIDDKVLKKPRLRSDESFIPLPVKLIEKGVPLPVSSNGINVTTTEIDSTDVSLSSHDSMDHGINDEIKRKVSAIPKLPYEELREATNNWSDRNLLGQGGFANVYKGEWKQLTVAVKRLRNEQVAWDRELIAELCLNQYRHDNIVPLYGYSYGGAEVCLVYQYMCGGTLHTRLRVKEIPPLTWIQRHRVAHGVARGLQFLHNMSGTPLIHGDIKPANILLDQCLIPKISDFGLARKGPYGKDRTHIKVSRRLGTRPYLPDEYLHSYCLSPALDVFSFGVVMLEIATGLTVVDQSREVHKLTDYIRIAAKKVDTAIHEDVRIRNTAFSQPQMCRDFISIGLDCTETDRTLRPNMLTVFKTLDGMNVCKQVP